MTKETNDIVKAYKTARQQGRRTALATVVHVEGSSYRRPGARMLVENDGRITGAISGGCLEGDALRKALLAINQQQNKLVTYNTLNDEDFEFGVQLGCNGIVHILFEPINSAKENNPVALLGKCLETRKDIVIATLFSLKDFHGHQPGTCYFFNDETIYSTLTNEALESEINAAASLSLKRKSSMQVICSEIQHVAFVEFIQPSLVLHIIEAGNDALPLMEMASFLGWDVTVIDGRQSHANRHRFVKAKKIIVGKPAEVTKQLEIDDQSVFVLMTHNYYYDLEILPFLLQSNCKYVGILGPKKRLERLLIDLQRQGHYLSEDRVCSIYGPTGLDIGAEAAEEIALSVVAEIQAVVAKRKGTFLRDRLDTIHSRC